MNAENDSKFTFRDVEDMDLEAVLRLNEMVVPAVNSIDMVQVEWFAANAAYFRVATYEDELAAFLIGMRPGTNYASLNYRWFCDAYENFGYIDRIAVTESARRRGLATRFYRDFETTLLGEVGVLTCEVNIEPPNESSMRFHARYGFRQVGSQQLDDGLKLVALMAKELRR